MAVWRCGERVFQAKGPVSERASGGKELVDCGPSQSDGELKRAQEEVRKVVRDHVMGSVWDLFQVR